MSLIELKNIKFRYDSEDEWIFDDFSYSIEAGKCVVIIGDNGSGKSTLFRILNGLSFPQKGQYFFDGQEITRDFLKNNQNAKQFHKRVGYLFQNPDTMLFNGTVYDEIAFGPRQMGLPDKEVDERVSDLLKLFDIEKLQHKAPYHLSGGQKKRVALASVMALNPEVLVLDEPLAGLDQLSVEWLTDFLLSLKEAGKTLIIATHNTEFEETIADEIISMGTKMYGDED